MPLNVGRLADLMELYAGRGGVNRDKIPRKLLKEVINFKLKEFARRTAVVSSKVTRSSIPGQAEYEQVADALHITKVNYDGSIATKIRFEEVDVIKQKVS